MEKLQANSYPVSSEIKLTSPAKFVQFVLIEKGDKAVSVKSEKGNEIFTNYLLQQNYPNLFNPETEIKFQIPMANYVSLKVYDILGREVATLIDEFKKAGSYSAQFSVQNSQLSSGVYFYKLKAGDYMETKKMLLMK